MQLAHHLVRVGVHHHHISLLLHQNLQRLVIQARVLLDANSLILLPPALHNPALPHQTVLEGGVGGQETVVVAVEDEVAVVGGLLGIGNVLWPCWHKLNCVLGAEEDTHQAGHHGANGVSHLHSHHLAAPIFLGAKQVTPVVLGALGSDGTQVGVDVADCICQLHADDALQFVKVHDLNGLGVGV